ncbi:MAG TPA: gliding motility protein GldL [Bacteroidales bacterium]|jgi:gliding motility-associated protein GldL|nr:gliding motility protein GldL [Bacteroidales bacterium]HOW09542.1 gliding motility protein GldL [Bacteroidales bacterium]
MNLAEIVQSSGWKNFMAKLYGIGASVVIVGALFKIQHWQGAGIMLTVGLFTEAIIFFFSAFEPLHEEVDWTLVYPELAGIQDEEPRSQAVGGSRYAGSVSGGGAGGGSLALSKFDELLEKADITPELFQKLGAGMKKLGEATSNISAMGDVSAASTKYMNTINSANDALGKLSETYQATARIINDSNSGYGKMAESISVIESGGRSYQQQLEVLNKNLSALNAVYELQRKGVDEHIKESDNLQKGIQNLMKDLNESAGDAKKYREQIARLNDNLTALNNVYGNMLAAMNVK